MRFLQLRFGFIARRSIILLQIGIGFLIPFALTIGMGIIYAAATFQILDPTEYLSELLFSIGITFVLCFVPLFWGAIAYARLQIVCQHLGFWLKGAVENDHIVKLENILR